MITIVGSLLVRPYKIQSIKSGMLYRLIIFAKLQFQTLVFLLIFVWWRFSNWQKSIKLHKSSFNLSYESNPLCTHGRWLNIWPVQLIYVYTLINECLKLIGFFQIHVYKTNKSILTWLDINIDKLWDNIKMLTFRKLIMNIVNIYL